MTTFLFGSPGRLLAVALLAWSLGCAFLGYVACRINHGRECPSCGRPSRDQGMCQPCFERQIGHALFAAPPGPLPRRAPGHGRTQPLPTPSQAALDPEVLSLLGVLSDRVAEAARQRGRP